METSTKVIAAIAGVALIGFVMASRKTTGDNANGADLPGINGAAFTYLTANAQQSAQITMNRDQITGATTIASLNAIKALTQSSQDMAAKFAQTNAGIVNAQIQAGTAATLEASRASVANAQIKATAKAASRNADVSELNTILGAAGSFAKIGASVFNTIWA